MKDNLAADEYSDWDNIQGDILHCIADMAHSVLDVIRMSAVCQSWQTYLMDRKIDLPICLMQVTKKENSDKPCLYNISKEIFVQLDLPEIRARRCWGSPFGWLITFGFDHKVQLFNPLSRATLLLPSLRTSPSSVLKLILLKSPDDSESDCIIMAIYSLSYTNYLIAFAKPGDQAWTPIRGIGRVDDVMYFKGNIYACEADSGNIFLCQDLDGDDPKAVKFTPWPLRLPRPSRNYFFRKYLFHLGGNLCVASREIDSKDLDFVTSGFMIFKLDMQTRIWENIYSLGDTSLFLGHCSTFAVAAADYSGSCRPRPNCIYFTDDHRMPHLIMPAGRIYLTGDISLNYNLTGGSDVGIYDFGPGLDFGYHTLDPFPNLKHIHHPPFSRSLWFIPYSH